MEVPGVDDQAGRAAEGFARAYGPAAQAQGVWWAPGRVNLIGEHVDYHGGLCLPVALPVGTAVALRLRDDLTVRLGSGQSRDTWRGALDRVGTEPVPGWAAYVAGVAWALREAGHDVPGFDAWVDGAVPLGSGLSSSAALECAVAVALADLLGLPGADEGDDAGRSALATACVRAENDIAGAATGGMDQAVSLRAREGHALLLDCRDFAGEHVPLAAPLGTSALEVVVVDTRAEHSHSDGQYGQRRELSVRAAGELGVEVLRDVDPASLDDVLATLPDEAERAAVRHVVTEIQRVREAAAALREGRPDDLGPLMTASHVSLRDDYQVSSPELDAVVDAAGATGATGARMTGGGFGGSAVVLCEPGVTGAVLDEVSARFTAEGWEPPRSLRPATGSGPARRVG